MTFNLRYASHASAHSWEVRRPVNKALLKRECPDVVGTQEGLYEQIKDIAADQPAYAWIGLGREGGNHGEHMAVFYRRDRLEPLEYDHFWLSATPDLGGSRSWGHTCPRMVTWVRFLDRASGGQFFFWNTHFDHESQRAREKATALVLQRVLALITPHPVILVGDFNATARDNTCYDLLTAPGAFTDSWFSATQRDGEDFATFHGYQPPVPGGAHIDWILTRGAVTTLQTHVVNFEQNGQYPSDHFPVVATLQLAPPSN